MDKIAVGYARRSLEEKEAGSLETQRKAIEDWCNRNGYNLIKVYEEKKSASDKEEEGMMDMSVRDYIELRPIFSQMLKELKSMTLLIVWKWDRFSRGAWMEQLVSVLKEKNCSAISVTEGDHPLTRSIMGVINKGFIDNLKDVINTNRLKILEQGYFPYRSPYGYKKSSKLKGIKPDKDYPIVVDIFKFALEDKSQRQIKELIKHKYSIDLREDIINRILKLLVYAGKCEFSNRMFDCEHEHPISYEEYNKIQELIKKRKLKAFSYRA